MSRYKTKNDNINLDSPTLQEYVKKRDVVALYIDRWGEGSPVTINLWIDLMKMKQADVVEVVRCRDCKYCVEKNAGGMTMLYCNLNSHYTLETNFCNYGEMKEQCEKD